MIFYIIYMIKNVLIQITMNRFKSKLYSVKYETNFKFDENYDLLN